MNIQNPKEESKAQELQSFVVIARRDAGREFCERTEAHDKGRGHDVRAQGFVPSYGVGVKGGRYR